MPISSAILKLVLQDYKTLLNQNHNAVFSTIQGNDLINRRHKDFQFKTIPGVPAGFLHVFYCFTILTVAPLAVFSI
jgi:hypothetical protein